jgi:hypothetical protein
MATFKTISLDFSLRILAFRIIGLHFTATRSDALFQNQSQTYGCNIAPYYDIDLNDIYNLGRSMPQGCSCQSSTADPECVTFDCDCRCDLVAGICDSHCCCDPDCTSPEIARFESSDLGCMLNGNELDFHQCYDAQRVIWQFSPYRRFYLCLHSCFPHLR